MEKGVKNLQVGKRYYSSEINEKINNYNGQLSVQSDNLNELVNRFEIRK